MTWRTDIPKENLLGVGLYTVSEAAAFVRAQPQQVMRWVHGNKQGTPVIHPQFEGHREVVSFLDMVQAMAVRDMRVKKNIPLNRIRQAIEWLEEHRPKITYPFAREHRTFMVQTTKELAYLLPEDDDKNILQISGKNKGQYVHAKMLDKYLEELKFGPDGLAEQFEPMVSGEYSIVLNPEIRFGQPRVEPSGYLVETLVQACETEGGTEAAAWWYNIEKAEVELAVKYQQSLWGSRYARAS